jgi:hypothetical protein
MIVFSGTKAHEALSSAEAFCRQVGLSFGSLEGAAINARIAEMLI